MRKLYLVIAMLVVLSLGGYAVASGAVPAVASLSRGAAAQAQATAAPVPSTQATTQANTAGQATAPLTKNLPAGITELQDTLAELYSAVAPSVVNINVLTSLTGSETALPDIPQHRNLPEQNTPQAESLGSGFVWDNQGHIITNNHVVAGASRISVTFSDGMTAPAELVGSDAQSDLAVIKVDPTKVGTLQPLALGDSTQVRVGQFVAAIGNPFGLEGTMTFGIVSALGRSLPVESGATSAGSYTIPDIIQTDAPVNPGNSGGVLLDMSGRLVGVPTAIESESGSNSGVGFAIPSVIVQKVVPELISSGAFQHPYIGIRGGTLSSLVAEAMGLPTTTRGALVVEVTAGSPAEKAGLQGSTRTTTIDGLDAQIGGDVITAVNGQAIRDFEDLTTYLARSGKVGDQLNLTILRNGNTQSVTVTLAARPDEVATTTTPSQPEVQITPRAPESQATPNTPNAGAPSIGGVYLGVSGLTVSSSIAQAMDLGDRQGVLIVTVVPGSPADAAGLRGGDQAMTVNGQQLMLGGDVITAVDGEAVGTIEDLVAAIQAKKAGDTVTLTIFRDGEDQTVKATLATRGATGQSGTTTPATPSATEAPTTVAPQGSPTPLPTQVAPSGQATPGATQAAPGAATTPTTGGAWLGINGMTLSAQMAQMMGLSDQQGVLLMNVIAGSPAEKAGLQGMGAGMGQGRFLNADIVVAVDGKTITTMDELANAIQAKKVGDTITLTVLRNGQRQDVTATLGARPAQ